MATISPQDIAKEIKSGNLKNIYYIYGKDTGRVEKISKFIKQKFLGKEYSSADYTRIEGKKFNFNNFTDVAEMYPMFQDYNFIEINDLNGNEISADETKAFIKFISDIPEKTVILITVTGFDVKAGKKAPDAKNKKIIDAVSKCGTVTEADIRKPFELVKFIMDTAGANGSSISKQNAEKLAELCLGNTLLIESELGKLCAYANGSEITSEMFELIVSPQLDTTAFALAGAVTSFNSVAAMKIVDQLMALRVEAVIIISALSSAFIDLYRAKTAIEASLNVSDVSADFSYGAREFVVRGAFRDARKTTREHLRKCLLILCKADLECKSSHTDQRIIIEKAIVEMLLQRNGE